MTTTARLLTLVFPRPPAALSPNARCHWAKKHRAVRDYRFTIAYQAIALTNNAQPLLSPVTIGLRLSVCGRSKAPDLDNLTASFKAGLDGLVDAGIIPNDSPEHVRGITPSAEHCPRGCKCGGQLTVTVEKLP